MKDSSFGQGKKIPPQFNDYMNIFRGLEEIVDTAYNQVEDRMLLEFRDVLSGSKEEANRTDEVIRYYMKVQRQNAKVSLDKFDLYMKDQFEPAYVAHKRQSHYRQLKQQQRRLINFDKLDLFDGIAVNINLYWSFIKRKLIRLKSILNSIQNRSLIVFRSKLICRYRKMIEKNNWINYQRLPRRKQKILNSFWPNSALIIMEINDQNKQNLLYYNKYHNNQYKLKNIIRILINLNSRMTLMNLKLQYNSEDLNQVQQRFLIDPKIICDEFIQIVSGIIKLSEEKFQLNHIKDGFYKKIIKGWSLSFYDIETDDVILVSVIVEKMTLLDLSSFIFTKSQGNVSFDSEQEQKVFFETTLLTWAENSTINEKILQFIYKREEKEAFLLISQQANTPNLLDKIDSDGWAIIHYIVFYRCEYILEQIWQQQINFDINVETNEGWTPLQIAINQQLNQAPDLLLKFPKLQISKCTNKGSALHIACKLASKKLVKLLIDNNADINLIYQGQNCYQVCNPQMKQYIISLQDGIPQNNVILRSKINIKIMMYSQVKPFICMGSVVVPSTFFWQLKERYLVLNLQEGTLKRFLSANDITNQPKKIFYISDISCIKNNYNQFGLSDKYFWARLQMDKGDLIFGVDQQVLSQRWITMIRQAVVYQKNLQTKMQKINNFETLDQIDLDKIVILQTPPSSTQQSLSPQNTNNNQEIVVVQKEIVKVEEVQAPLLKNQSKFNQTKILSEFEIKWVLGQGAFGIVFLVTEIKTQQQYAMKIQSKLRLIRKKQIKYAVIESQILQEIDSPFVLKLYYAFQTPKNLYLIIDYCPGEDLYQYLTKLNRFREDVARFYMCEILVGLLNIHDKNIVYRDLKPENVLLASDGHVKLADFGLSKREVEYEVLTKSFCGSPAYMSPEMLGRVKIGKYGDYYAYGILMFELLTGIPPFIGQQLEQVYERILMGVIDYPPYMTTITRDLIDKLTNKDPYQRMTLEQAKSHEWFKGVDWEKVSNRKYNPPFKINNNKKHKQSQTQTQVNNLLFIIIFSYIKTKTIRHLIKIIRSLHNLIIHMHETINIKIKQLIYFPNFLPIIKQKNEFIIMKYLTLFLVILSLNALDLNDDYQYAQIQKSLEDITSTQTGAFIMEMAQFHSEMHGPLDDLLETLKQLISELEIDLQRLDNDYTKRTNEHERVRQSLEDDIGTIQFSLAASLDNIDNLLIPTIDQTQSRIDQIVANIKGNRDALQRATQVRSNEHQSYLDRVNDNTNAMNAIDECLQLLKGIQNGNVAFTEKASLNRSLRNVRDRLNKQNEYGPMIDALIQMAQNFNDQSTLAQIINSLNDLRKQFTQMVQDETQGEQNRVAEWVLRQKSLSTDYNEFQNQIKQLTYTLVAFKNQLVREKKYNLGKTGDLQALQEQLDLQNSNFANDSQIYQELKSQCVKELDTARKALEFLNSANFSNLLKQRMNSGPLSGR